MSHFERKISQEEIYRGRIIRVTNDTVVLENGKTAQREVVHHNGGAAIVPVNEAGEIYLVRQFRYPYGKELLEIPAGKVEPGEDPMETAKRELMEECGLAADEFVDLFPVYPSVGYCDEVISCYLAKGLHSVEAQPDEDEFLNVEKYPIEEAAEMVMNGSLPDAKTSAAILKVFLLWRQGKL